MYIYNLTVYASKICSEVISVLNEHVIRRIFVKENRSDNYVTLCF